MQRIETSEFQKGIPPAQMVRMPVVAQQAQPANQTQPTPDPAPVVPQQNQTDQTSASDQHE